MNGPSKARFQEIYDKGHRVSGAFCRILFAPGSGALGLATAKATGNQPRRNRAKRRFRAALAEVPVRIPDGLDVVIQISAKGAEASYSEIRDDLAATLEKLNERWASESASS